MYTHTQLSIQYQHNHTYTHTNTHKHTHTHTYILSAENVYNPKGIINRKLEVKLKAHMFANAYPS